MFELQAIKDQIAQIIRDINCIKNGDCCDGNTGTTATTHPDEPWVQLLTAGMTTVLFTPKPGVTLVGDPSSVNVIFNSNIIGPNSIAVNGTVSFSITLATGAAGFEGGGCNVTLRFPAFSSVTDGWFNGTLKVFSDNNTRLAVGGNEIEGPTGASEVKQFGNTLIEFDRFGSANQITFDSEYELTTDGTYTIDIDFNAVVALEV